MKNSKKLLVSLITLTSVFDSAYAGRLAIGNRTSTTRSPVGGSTSSSGGTHSSEPAKDLTSKTIECEQGTSVTYDFLTNLSGSEVELEKTADNLIVSMPEYFSACISKINLNSKLGSDNNVYLKFDIEPTLEMKNSTGDKTEQKYENCVSKIIANNPDLIIKGGKEDGAIDYKKADELGLIARGKFRKTVSLSSVDRTKDSEVIIASPNRVSEFNGIVFNEVNGKIGDSSEAQWNCMRFEQPQASNYRIFQTEKTKLIDQAIAICNRGDNASIHDVEQIRAELLRSETLGNFSPLISTLSDMKYRLLKSEIDLISEELDRIETKFEPSEEDDEIGVSKKEAKKLVDEYQAHMKNFNDELLPQIKADLKILLDRRDDAETDEEKEKIDEQIEKISELIMIFNREDVNSERFAYLVRGLKISADSAATKEVFKAMINGKYFARVYEGEANDRESKLSLDEAQRKSDIESKAISTKTLTAWQDEKDIKAGRGDKVVKRNQKVYSEISKRARDERVKFQQKNQSGNKYFSEYLKRGQKHYCQNGYDQSCISFMQRAQGLQYQYGMSQQTNARKFEAEWGARYGGALESQKNKIGMYQSMNDQYQMEAMRKKLASETRYGTYGGTDYDYSFFDYGASSGSDMYSGFDLDYGMTDYDQYQNFPMFPQGSQPQLNQNRGPATNFSNPYEYYQGPR